MPNTYSQLYIQFVFAVKYREALIHELFRAKLQKYITGIVQSQKYKHKLLAIYCMPDHAHIFIGLNPDQSISDCVRIIKCNSSKWINQQHLTPYKFRWQTGYGAFSYSRSHIDRVVKYIRNQPHHHRKKTFKKEYLQFLEKFKVPYNEQYLFDWII